MGWHEQNLSIDKLRMLVRYDAESGHLFWLPRLPSYFAPTSSQSPARQANAWNARWAEQRALTFWRDGKCLAGKLCGRTVSAHRVAWALATGAWPTGEIDHINGNPSDNRLINLRDVSHGENMRNAARPAHNTSGTIGVAWCRNRSRWQATIKHDRKQTFLGYFPTEQDAVAARKAAERDLGFHPNHGRAA